MRHPSTLVILMIPTLLSAQSWCPPRAVWTYRYDGWGVDYRAEHRHVGDTLLDGRAAFKVQVTELGTTNGGAPIAGTWMEYTAFSDEVVWVYDALAEPPNWDTLYWFGAQTGDRWWPPGQATDCAPLGMLEVQATDVIEIDGPPLRTWSVATLGEDGTPMTDVVQLVERIGMTPRIPHLSSCGGSIDYFFPHFVCYSDQDIQVPSGTDCSLALSTTVAPHPGTTITLYPNPGLNGFALVGFLDGPINVRISDLLGRVVADGLRAMPEEEVLLPQLAPGCYCVELTTRTGQRHGMRWVKKQD